MAIRLIVDTPVSDGHLPGGLFDTVNVVDQADAHAGMDGIQFRPSPLCATVPKVWGHGACGVGGLTITGSAAKLATGTDTYTESVVTVVVSGGFDALDSYTVVLTDANDATLTMDAGTPDGTYSGLAIVDTGYAGTGPDTAPFTVTVTDSNSVAYTSAGFTPSTTAAVDVVFAGLVKDFGGIGDDVEAVPFVLYSGVKCGAFNKDDPENLQRAKDVLAAGEQFAVERHLWDTVLPGAATAITPGATAKLAQAEALFRQVYQGVPVFHMTPYTASSLLVPSSSGRVVRDGDVFRTITGSLVVVGSGYGPDIDPASMTTTPTDTVYVTGMLQVYRLPVIANSAATYEQNEFGTIAERQYMIANECETYSFELSS